MNEKTIALLVGILSIIIAAACPIIFIVAVNVLFGLSIPITVGNYLASLVLLMMTGGIRINVVKV